MTELSTRSAMQEKSYYVYLLTTWNNRVMYVGVTNNLERRIYEHRIKLVVKGAF